MCGIIGYSVAEDHQASLEHKERIQRLCFESRVRGQHAFVFTMLHRDGYVSHAMAISLKELNQELDKVWDGRTVRPLVGHCRYSTSGDYQVMDNNQAVVL